MTATPNYSLLNNNNVRFFLARLNKDTNYLVVFLDCVSAAIAAVNKQVAAASDGHINFIIFHQTAQIINSNVSNYFGRRSKRPSTNGNASRSGSNANAGRSRCRSKNSAELGRSLTEDAGGSKGCTITGQRRSGVNTNLRNVGQASRCAVTVNRPRRSAASEPPAHAGLWLR